MVDGVIASANLLQSAIELFDQFVATKVIWKVGNVTNQSHDEQYSFKQFDVNCVLKTLSTYSILKVLLSTTCPPTT